MFKTQIKKKSGHWVYATRVVRNGRTITPKRKKVLRFFVAD